MSPSSKPLKRIFLYEIAFTNGWKIKEQPHIYFTIYTNSLEERNTLINHLINSVGFDPIAIDLLEPNITYYFKASGSLEDYKLDVSPDEFWSEENLGKKELKHLKKIKEKYLKNVQRELHVNQDLEDKKEQEKQEGII